MTAPSPRQAELLDFVMSWTQLKQRPPSLTECNRALRFGSLNGAHEVMMALVRKGYINHEPGRARDWVVTKKAREWQRGRIEPGEWRPL